MVSRKVEIARRPLATSEVMVNGLFGGLLAGLAMLAVLILLALLRGEPPVAVLARFAGSEAVSPWIGLLRHESVAGVYGLLFGLLWGPLARRFPSRLPAALAGLVFGLALFALAELVILPRTDPALLSLPAFEFGLAHLVYGSILGAYLGSREEQ